MVSVYKWQGVQFLIVREVLTQFQLWNSIKSDNAFKRKSLERYWQLIFVLFDGMETVQKRYLVFEMELHNKIFFFKTRGSSRLRVYSIAHIPSILE